MGESATPTYTFTNLESGIYEFKAQTISDPANEHFADSDWSDLGEVDLHWCELDLSAPQNITTEMSGEKLTISWNQVKDAQYYLVDVFASGFPTTYVTQNVYTVSTSLSVTVPELGEYEARVTAYGPFGKSQSEASLKGVEVVMSQVKNLKVNEVGETSFSVVWDDVAFAEGYQVDVFELSGETKDISSDYSKLPAVVGDSAGNEWKFDAYCMGENYADGDARLDYVDAYFETAIYPEAISQVKYAFEYSGTKDAIWGEDSILLEASRDGKEWIEIERTEVKEAKTSLATAIATMDGFRALRFKLVSTGNTRPMRGVAFSPVTITCGEIVETQIRDVKTQEKQYAIDGLRENGKYTVKVSPLPQGNADLSAKTPVIDLATAKPMFVNACSIASLYNNRYDENFSSLSDVVKATDIKNVSLENWQMYRNGEAVSQVKFSAGGNPTASGVYVCSNSEKEESSYSIGTLSSADCECILGVAFSNDCYTSISDFSISFTAMQRTFKDEAKTLRLEYLVTDKGANVSMEGDWKEIEIPVTAPLTSATCGETKIYEKHIELDAIQEVVPQGAMVLIRWRDVKRSKSPLMSIDNVTFKYTLTPSPTMIYLR
ncbi:MAG: fibronectin type III domain-containing protein [Kiritimatiellae bacterium]|nr:fibronectin type III domain-containing protein [Kiritimatiellia bacterium]